MRWQRRRELATRYMLPMASLTLNIPGPDKSPPWAERLMPYFEKRWRFLLKSTGLTVIHEERHTGADGAAVHMVVNCTAFALKHCAMVLENSGDAGRLADVDVLDAEGSVVGREQLQLPPRTCLLCSRPAALCIREGRHSTEEVTSALRRLAVKLLYLHPMD